MVIVGPLQLSYSILFHSTPLHSIPFHSARKTTESALETLNAVFMYKVIYSKCFILETSNCTLRAFNKRLLQPPVTSAYYTLSFGNCCLLQPSAVFCVSFARPRKTCPTGQPQHVPSHFPAGRGAGPRIKDQEPWEEPRPQAVPASCLPGYATGLFWHGRRAHIPLSPAARMTNG